MKTAVVIPARYNASRLPGKLLLTVDGCPLIVHVLKQASKCSNVHVVVATDDMRIADVVRSAGGTAVLTRSDHTSGTDRIAEVVSGMPEVRYIVNVQGDEPFINPEDIQKTIVCVHAETSEMVTLATSIEETADFESPHVVKVVCDDAGRALYFSRSPIPYFRAAGKNAVKPLRHIGIYGYQREALMRFTQAGPGVLETAEQLEQLRALAMGMRIQVLHTQHAARGIDTEEDLAWARAHVARLGPKAFP